MASVLRDVDRAHFVPQLAGGRGALRAAQTSVVRAGAAYVDAPQPLGCGGATISAPHVHGMALQLLASRLRPGARVLDVGSGSGYLTTCFGLLVSGPGGTGGTAVGIERLPALVSLAADAITRCRAELLDSGAVVLVAGDATAKRLPAVVLASAPYDAIHVGAAAPSLEAVAPLVELLRPARQDFAADNNFFMD